MVKNLRKKEGSKEKEIKKTCNKEVKNINY